MPKNFVDVSHEALIRGWPRLRGWLDQDRAGLRLHRRITEAAEDWRNANRDDGFLFRGGARLTQAHEWWQLHDAELNSLEREFLDASAALHDRLETEEREQQQRDLEAVRKLASARQRVLWLVAGLLGLACGAGFYLLYLQGNLREQRTRLLQTVKDLTETQLSLSDAYGTLKSTNIDLEKAEENAALAKDDISRSASRANVSLARYAEQSGDKPLALAHLAQALRLNPQNGEAVSVTTSLLMEMSVQWPLGEPMKHEASVYSAQFSPDGQRVVTASFDGTARLWDAATGKSLGKPMQHEAKVVSAQFSPDGQRVVTASFDGTARLWDAAAGKSLGKPMMHKVKVVSAQFSPDGQHVVTASSDNTARLWDATTGKSLGEPMQHEASVYSAQFSPDGLRVVTASSDNTARLWDATTGKSLGEPMQHEASVYSAQFSPDGQSIVTASGDKTARLWDATTGKSLGEPMQHDNSVHSTQFSPDGQRVVTASGDHTARLWDAATGKPLGEPMRHDDSVYSAQFSPDGQRVVTASSDKTVRLWDATSGKPLGEPMKHDDSVYSAQFNPDGQCVVTASGDHTARLWDAATGKPLGEPMQHNDSVHSTQFSPDGQRVVTASGDHTARLWEAATGKPFGEPMKHEASVYSAQFSPDGQRIVTASRDHIARLWDAATGKALGKPIQAGYPINFAQFRPDGQQIVITIASLPEQVVGNGRLIRPNIDAPSIHAEVAAEDLTASTIPVGFATTSNGEIMYVDGTSARLWDAATGNPLGEPMRHDDSVYSAQFSPDGQRVVTASGDKTARLWDATTGKALGERMVHKARVWSARFSPDSQRVVTASEDHTMRLWDAATGNALGPSIQHQAPVIAAQFSPDGQFVITASTNKTARIWEVATGRLFFRPMKHEDKVKSAQFSPDGQRVITASADRTARLWDTPVATINDSPAEILFLVELAEVTGGAEFVTSGQTEVLMPLLLRLVTERRAKIAATFADPSVALTPLRRFLKWSVADRRSRTISPLSSLTVPQWIENRIKDGDLAGLQEAMQVDPGHPRLTAHLGRRLADLALSKETHPDEARRARGEADFLTRQAEKLAPDDPEIKGLRAEVVELLKRKTD